MRPLHHEKIVLAPSPSEPTTTARKTMRNGERKPRPRRIRAWHVAGVLLLFAVGILLFYAFWPVLTGEAAEPVRVLAEPAAEAAARVEVIVVDPTDFPLRAEATGHLAPWRKAEISAEAHGLVVERPIEEGMRVAAGALLLRLDDRDAQIELQEAEAELLKARADYAVSTLADEPAPATDTTRLALARETFRKAQQAFEQGLLSKAELQEARRRFEAAEVLSGRQREAVQAVTSGLTQAEQRLERARLALSRTRITAPFGGRIADLDIEMGQRVGAGQQVFVLLDDGRMKVAVDVLEADLVRLRKGVTARVRVPALGEDPFLGTIYAINPSVDSETGTGRVTVAIPNPQGRLIAGLFAYVALETERLSGRLVVPAEAVLTRQGRDLVFCIESGRAQWIYVTAGSRSGDMVEITEGLSPGDTVAVAGHFALAHDAPVKVGVVREPDTP